MGDATNFLSWIERAEEDYIVAQSSLRRKKALTYSACFHSQQCAEKYLKALLVAKGYSFPKVHDLILLNDLCTKAGILVMLDVKELNTLSDYAVRVRYPGEDPTSEESRHALEIAKSVRRFVRKFLGV